MRGVWLLKSENNKLPLSTIIASANSNFHRGEGGYGSYLNFGDHFRIEKKTDFLEFPRSAEKAHTWAVNYMNPVELKEFLPVVFVGKKNLTKTNFSANDVLLFFNDGKFFTNGLESKLISEDFIFKSNNGSTVFAGFVQKGLLDGLSLFDSVIQTLRKIPCDFSGFFIRNNETVAVKGIFGNKELAIYKNHNNGKKILALSSETPAFGIIDPFFWKKLMNDNPYGDGVRDLFPGETIYMEDHEILKAAIISLENVFWGNGKGKDVKTFSLNDSLGELINSMTYVNSEGFVYDGLMPEFVCGFGNIYYNSPAANNHQVSCIRFRARLGRYLSSVPEGIDHDKIVVIPVPDSGRAAASGYANQYNYKLREGLIKAVKRRSYTIYDKQERDELAEIKYLVVPGAFHDGKKGKVVVFLDDSIVRGTTVYRLIVKAFEAGAAKVFFKASSPPLKYFCPFGDDMKKKMDLIAIEKDTDQICEEIFDLCRIKINKNYKKGIYDKSERDYMLSKINNENVDIEYQKIDDLIDCFDSFFVNKKQRVCLGCITGEFPYKP